MSVKRPPLEKETNASLAFLLSCAGFPSTPYQNKVVWSLLAVIHKAKEAAIILLAQKLEILFLVEGVDVILLG